MISREDIKEGLKFRMPSNTLKRKRQVEGFGNIPEFREPTQHLTTLKTPGGDKRYITPEIPLFEVCGGSKLISSADKNDPHCAWVGEYIKVRSDALGKKPLYISLNDVMQHGLYANGSNNKWQKSNCNLKSNNMQEIVFRSNDNQALTTRRLLVYEKPRAQKGRQYTKSRQNVGITERRRRKTMWKPSILFSNGLTTMCTTSL